MANATQKCANAFLNNYEPNLEHLQKQLTELTCKQNELLLQLENENSKFTKMKLNELNAMFLMIQEYQLRLTDCKKEMCNISERSKKLKKRALRLQEYKQKKALENADNDDCKLRRNENQS